jgi:hypothetical protein
MESSFLGTLAATTVASTTLSGLFLWFLQSLITERLKNEIKFEYDRKFSTFSAELTRLSEDRTRKLERLLSYYERQIEEYYGPLWNMVHQLYVCNETKDKMIKSLDREQKRRVEDYYQSTYFRPLHTEIRQIIKTKLYLTDGATMPDSFYKYLRHATQEHDQGDLAQNYGIDTSYLRGVPWPADFHDDIKAGFDQAMKHYQQCLDGLRAS